MTDLSKTLSDDLERSLRGGVEPKVNNLKEAMKAAELPYAPPSPPKLQHTVITKTAVMTRLADAMHRVERLAEAIEKAADEADRQLEIVRRRL